MSVAIWVRRMDGSGTGGAGVVEDEEEAVVLLWSMGRVCVGRAFWNWL